LKALRPFNGEGACKLIDYDEEKDWMLLECLHPGSDRLPANQGKDGNAKCEQPEDHARDAHA